MGGSDDVENLELLTIEEHAEAHRVLWETYGKQADFMAWKMLLGKTDASESMRIAVAVEAFREMLADPARYDSWRTNISNTLRGRTQSAETKAKRSNTIKEMYRNPSFKAKFLESVRKRKPWKPPPEHFDKMAEGRRKSQKWKDSVTSDEYRLKKTISDPRSQPVSVSGVLYHSIRQAARESGIPECRIHAIRKGLKADDRISFPQLGNGLPDHVLSQEAVTFGDRDD